MSNNINWHRTTISKVDRQRLNCHKSFIVWFTGLSGSGKSTIANAVEESLHRMGVHTYLLDGDNIRHGLNVDLGFSPENRRENIRRIGEVSKLFVDAGVVVMTAFISPYRAERDLVRGLVDNGEFIEVYVKCPLPECERRDPKGLYLKARGGEIVDFTGLSAPYEEPLNPELVVESDKLSVEEAAARILNKLDFKQF